MVFPTPAATSTGGDAGGPPRIGPASIGAAMPARRLAILVVPGGSSPLVLVEDGDIQVLYNRGCGCAASHRGRYPGSGRRAREVDEDEHARLMARGHPAAPQ